jgi:hypothetical protein
MDRRRRTGQVLLLLAGGCLAACDSPTEPIALEPAFHDVHDGMVPLQAQEVAWPAPDATPVLCDPAFAGVVLPNRLLAAGTGSHFGKLASVILGTGCAVNLATGVVSMAGTAVHTAANGDRLFATWTGTMLAGSLTLDINFSGGTGRFQGVTGSGLGSGTMNPATGSGEWTINGRITPPGR